MTSPEPVKTGLYLRVGDVPKLPSLFLFGFQQTMLCLSGLLVVPFLVSDVACAGSSSTELRVKLIAATFVTSGIATLLQTTFGLRLSILHGPSFAFLPPILAYKAMPENKCLADEYTYVPKEEWMARVATIQGSLLLGVVPMIIIGSTGLVGQFAKFVGPITICPLILLLSLGNIPTLEEKMSLHWVSLVSVCLFLPIYPLYFSEFFLLMTLIILLEDVCVPYPYYSFKKRSFMWKKSGRIFGQFPYLIGIGLGWFVCLMLTVTHAEPEEGQARVDKNASISVLQNAPWFQVPLPGAYGAFRVDVGLMLGYVASAVACTMESIGNYNVCSRISEERHPPCASTNRGILCEGIGAAIAGLMGIGVGVTTYGENVALMQVASRATMQLAGVLLIVLGLLTKFAALLATIPEPIVGGVLGAGIVMVTGVSLSNLEGIDFRLSRNLSIMGLAIVAGVGIPLHFEQHPLHTGNDTIDNIFNMLLSIRMLVGGVVAFVFDNLVGGATKAQRGFPDKNEKDQGGYTRDGYSLPVWFEKILMRFSWLQKIPILPHLPPYAPPLQKV